MKACKLRAILLAILSFLLFAGLSRSQEVIVSYDYSGSMRMYGLTEQDFANWNRVLKEVLFRGEPNLSGKIELIHRDHRLDYPIVKAGSKVTFLRIGDRVTSFFERQSVDEIYFSSKMPQRFTELHDQKTNISEAELYFFRVASKDSNTIWVNLSDNDNDIGIGLPAKSDSARALIELRKDMHIEQLLDISFNERVHLGIRKRKSIREDKLAFESSHPELLFREMPKSRRSKKMYNLAHNHYFTIHPKKVASPEIHGVAMRITLTDKKERELESVSRYPSQLPFTVDSLVFKDAKAVAALEKKEADHLYIRVRYYHVNKLHHQDFVQPISYGSGGLGWLFWLLFIPLLIVAGGLAAKNLLFTERSIDQFTLISQKPRSLHKTINLKKNGKILFGRPRIGQVQGAVCDIKAPDYALVRKDLKVFSLIRRDQEAGFVILKDPFTIQDRDGNDIELTLHEGHLQQRQPQKQPRQSTLKPRSSLKSRRK